MSPERLGALRRRMLAEVAAQTIYVSARIGKAALAKPVMEAMGNVPRHEFVPQGGGTGSGRDGRRAIRLPNLDYAFPIAALTRRPREVPCRSARAGLLSSPLRRYWR